VDGGVAVVAVHIVAATPTVAVFVEVLVDCSVAVIVAAVAELGSPGIGPGVGVVAILAVYETVAVPVSGTTLVDLTVAVRVNTVASLYGAGIDSCVGIVAVGWIPTGGPGVAVFIVALVDEGVAVVVRAVTDLPGAWVSGRVDIIAVDVLCPTVPVYVAGAGLKEVTCGETRQGEK